MRRPLGPATGLLRPIRNPGHAHRFREEHVPRVYHSVSNW
jgi:hypothetical protein